MGVIVIEVLDSLYPLFQLIQEIETHIQFEARISKHTVVYPQFSVSVTLCTHALQRADTHRYSPEEMSNKMTRFFQSLSVSEQRKE
jgi:hypothetical protein